MDHKQPRNEDLITAPVLSHPYREPDRHWMVGDGNIRLNTIQKERRPAVDSDTGEIDALVEMLRPKVREWRERHWPGTDADTRALLEYWARPPGQGPRYAPFFAQREAVETLIYLTEIASPVSRHCTSELREIGTEFSGGLTRAAFRMATGTGKTMVMACLILYYAIQRRRTDPHGLPTNVDRILVICPGRTIAKRLQVLDPRHPDNIYHDWDLAPDRTLRELANIPVDLVNFEKLNPKKNAGLMGLGNPDRIAIEMAGVQQEDIAETHHEMWSGLLPGGPKRRTQRVVVFNDEGHHCWKRESGDPGVWMEALEQLNSHPGFSLDLVLDFTATPRFINPNKTHGLKGKRPRPTHFPWTITRFDIDEAMESGLVKIPQLPEIADVKVRSLFGDLNPFSTKGTPNPLHNLFEANGKKDLDTADGMELIREIAEVLYSDYTRTHQMWESHDVHPVFIVVANTKQNAAALYHLLAGAPNEDGTWRRSRFRLFANAPYDGAKPDDCVMNSIMVVSNSRSPETEESVTEGGLLGVREVRGGRSTPTYASAEEMHDVLSTVARPGRAGASVRLVVSVGMLTEGWDCQNVTHILGYRKFGSALLCEQTLGRALRRQDYENISDPVVHSDTGEVEDRYPPEYAIAFGVPLRDVGESKGSPVEYAPAPVHTVKPSGGPGTRILVPNFHAYGLNPPSGTIRLDPQRVPVTHAVQTRDGAISLEITAVGVVGIIGQKKTITSGDFTDDARPGSNAFRLARALADLIVAFPKNSQEEIQTRHLAAQKTELFIQCLAVVREWLDHPNTHISERDLAADDLADVARGAIAEALIFGDTPARKVGLVPPSTPRHSSASDWAEFNTQLRHIFPAPVDSNGANGRTEVPAIRSELNLAACHSVLETRICEELENSPLVAAWTRNHGRYRFEIPYRYGGTWARYVPDFIVRLDPRLPCGSTLHIVVEGKGAEDEKDRRKAEWTQNWWIPCADDAGKDLRQKWAFVQVGPGDNTMDLVHAKYESLSGENG